MLRASFGIAALFVVSIFPACSSGSGGSGRGCAVAPYGACNEQSPAVLYEFDEVHGCIEASAPVAGVCLSSVLGTGCDASASIGLDCAFAPDGTMYLTNVRGDEYLSGTGWRSTHYPQGYGPTQPASDIATDGDLARCGAAQCAPPCGPGIDFQPALICRDAGAADAGQDGASDASSDVAVDVAPGG